MSHPYLCNKFYDCKPNATYEREQNVDMHEDHVFNPYIDDSDLPDNVHCAVQICKFWTTMSLSFKVLATKVFRKVTNDTDKQSLQDDLDKLVKWSEKLQILFNFGKCKCIHIGHGNMDEEYKMGDAVLGRTTQEKDLGVTFSADMKVSEQCGIAASKGNQILGLIRRTIMYKEKQLIVPLYKAIVRPHLEYCIQAWRPYRKKDIDKLERIQRRATKIIPELRDLSYESHLLQCGLTKK